MEHESCLKEYKSPCQDESLWLAFPKTYPTEQAGY